MHEQFCRENQICSAPFLEYCVTQKFQRKVDNFFRQRSQKFSKRSYREISQQENVGSNKLVGEYHNMHFVSHHKLAVTFGKSLLPKYQILK